MSEQWLTSYGLTVPLKQRDGGFEGQHTNQGPQETGAGEGAAPVGHALLQGEEQPAWGSNYSRKIINYISNYYRKNIKFSRPC